MTRGGKREGAGRKKLNEEKKKITKSFRISQELLIEIEKKFPNLTLSSIIEKALIEYVEKK
nr:MAG TPA: antitoxin [Caudoviricetes sp.]